MKSDLSPSYPHKAIANPEHLARLLNTSLVKLKSIAEKSNRSYRPVPQAKKDGSLRMTYDAFPELKQVHHQINKKILCRVHFPRYLHGGIRDIEFPRDQVSNAATHTNVAVLVSDDIANFYPSLDSKLVFFIWLNFFRFSPDVAELLTALTTYQGVVPQGAKTSSYLANLAFWDKEPELVEELQSMGLAYSRFVDDIDYSAQDQISNQTIAAARSKVYQMLTSKGCRPKRSKSHVARKGQRFEVTGLSTSATNPAIDKVERKRIRSAVHNLERDVHTDGMTLGNLKKLESAKGRVGRMLRLKHAEARSLSLRLEVVSSMGK